LAHQSGDVAERRHAFAGAMFELRQYGALLHAHGIPLQLDGASDSAAEHGNGALIDIIDSPDAAYGVPSLFAHEAPGLGVVAITVAQRGPGGRARTLAHAYPLQPAALGPLLAILADHFGSTSDLHALGHIQLDENGQLSAPSLALH
jgi:hypothetical protein